MDYRDYAAFLPAEYTAGLSAPVSTWWSWHGRQVHIARSSVPEAAVRVLVIHGGGGYSGALWPLATAAAGDGAEVLAPDLPLYGDTFEPNPSTVRYQDWVDLLCDLVVSERDADPRPLILFGASMGGMLAYEVAGRTHAVDAVVATCLLDTADARARGAASRFAWTGRPAPVVLRAMAPLLGRVRVPIRWLADMANMSAEQRLSELCASDPRGGGVAVPLGFVSSWMNYRHTAPEDYDGAPVTLVAPAADRWTPAEVSVSFLQRIRGSNKAVLLDNCGHFPIEEPGLSQLRAELSAVVSAVVQRAQ